MVESLELSTVIERFNSMSIFDTINYYLKYIHTDIGRLVLFTLILIVSYFLRNIGQMIFPALKKIFPTTEDVHDDIEVEDFLPLKEPLAFLIKLFGANLAIDILFYPNDPHPVIETIIYVAYIIGFSRLFIVLADIVFDVYFVSSYKKRNKAFRKELVNLIKQIIKVIVIVVAFLLFLREMDVDITGFVASLGLGGLMIAMASKDTVSNFFGSLKIIFDESFSQGDWIKVGDTEGTVVELGFISTKIRTFDNALISLPNAKLANESVKNYNRRKVGRRIKMYIGVTYDAKREDLKNAVKEIKQMLEDHPEIATESKVGTIGRRKSLIESSDLLGVKSTLLVHVDSFGDSSINILIYAFSKTTNWSSWLEVKEDIMMKIWQILEKNSLEMAFPTQTIHLKNDTKGEE
jgi:MscS family membrane protein